MKKGMNKTVKGIVAGLLVTVVGGLIYRFVMYEVTIHQFEKMSNSIVERSLETQQKLLAKQEEAKRLRQEEAARQKLESERRARAAVEQQRLRLEREKAFEASYKAPDGCDNWISDSHMVQCVNHRMRAKAEFDKSYPIDSPDSQIIYR